MNVAGNRIMKKSAFAFLLASFALTTVAIADELHLRDGKTVEGTFLSADTRQLKFLGPDGKSKTYPISDVDAVSFALVAAPAPVAAAPATAPKPTTITVPTGSTVLVRMLDSLDTRQTQTGALFTTSLDSNLVVNGVVVAKKGTTLHGKVTKSTDAGRMAGKSEMQLELIDIVINGAAHPITTSDFQQKGKSEGAATAKKTAAGAGLGAAIGAISGNAGKGAAIGAVSGVGLAAVKKGQPITVPSETLLSFTIAQSTLLPVQR
jgi:hypothetical protein